MRKLERSRRREEERKGGEQEQEKRRGESLKGVKKQKSIGKRKEKTHQIAKNAKIRKEKRRRRRRRRREEQE